MKIVTIISLFASVITLIAFVIALVQIVNSKKLIKMQAEITILSTTIFALIAKNIIGTDKDKNLISKSVKEILNLSIELGEDRIINKLKELKNLMEIENE